MAARRPIATGPVATLPNTTAKLRATQVGVEVWRSTAAATTAGLSLRGATASFGRPWPGSGIYVAVAAASAASGQLGAQSITATNLRATQVAVETWFGGPSNLRATQVGVELWRSTSNANPVNFATMASSSSKAASSAGFATRFTILASAASAASLNLTPGAQTLPVLFVN